MTDPGRLTELSAARYSAKVSGTGNPLPGSGHPGFDRLGCPLPAKTLRAPDPARHGDPLRPSGSYGRIVDSNKNHQFLFLCAHFRDPGFEIRDYRSSSRPCKMVGLV